MNFPVGRVQQDQYEPGSRHPLSGYEILASIIAWSSWPICLSHKTRQSLGTRDKKHTCP